jgi:hypothetical protein
MDFGLQEATVSRIFTEYVKKNANFALCPYRHRRVTTAPLRNKTDGYSSAPKYQTDECSSAPEKESEFSSAPKEDRNYFRSALKDRCMIAALFRKKTDYYSNSPKYDRKMTTALLRRKTGIITVLLLKKTEY